MGTEEILRQLHSASYIVTYKMDSLGPVPDIMYYVCMIGRQRAGRMMYEGWRRKGEIVMLASLKPAGRIPEFMTRPPKAIGFLFPCYNTSRIFVHTFRTSLISQVYAKRSQR